MGDFEMSGEPVLDRVRKVMVQTFRVPADVAIERETTSADIDGWDSLSHSLLIMNIEEEFGVDLPFDRVYELQNVGELADLLQEVIQVPAK